MELSIIPAAKLSELAKSAYRNGYTYIRIENKNLLAAGADPLNPTHVIDLKEETIRPYSGPTTTPKASPTPGDIPRRASRRSGKYYIEVKGRKVECVSLKEVLSEGLRAMEKISSGTLDELSTIKPRSKRIVAREPRLLFENPELVDLYAEELGNGWYFGTNNSTNETLSWLRRGAEIAGLIWGKDIETNFG